MSTPTMTRKSAWPATAESLAPSASALIGPDGQLPSRNQLMKSFGIGTAKAKAVLALLATDPALSPVETSPEVTATPEQPSEPAPVVVAITEPQSVLPAVAENPGTDTAVPAAAAAPVARRKVATWPVFLIALPAFVAIWSGWVGLGGLTGFGVVHPLPGIWDEFSINTAITLPIGVEVYAWYALKAWLSGTHTPRVARRFAKWSAIGSLVIGSAGQVAYHLMESAGMTVAPWQITTAVSCLPVIVLGMGAALAHLLNSSEGQEQP
jgi:hypothetical protein